MTTQSPMSLKIRAERDCTGDMGDTNDQDGNPISELFETERVFHLLYVNRGRTLWDAYKDAESCYVSDFMIKVESLHRFGHIEVRDDRIILRRKRPTSPLEWLAWCAS